METTNKLIKALFIFLIFIISVFTAPSTSVAYTTRVDFGVGGGPHDLALADLDDDGDEDIVTANYYGGSVSVLLNNGDGSFENKVDYSINANPRSLFLADIGEDTDGDIDIITANYQNDTVTVLTNDGNGTFSVAAEYKVGKGPFAVFVADIGEDTNQDLDIIIADTDDGQILILENNGDGTFKDKKAESYSVGSEPKGVFLSDLNGDGYNDIAANNWADYTVSVLLNTGDGTFTDHVIYPVGGGPRAIFVADLNGDTHQDIITANQFDNNITLLFNQGDGTFSGGETYPVGDNPLSVCGADIDKDGDIDLVTANLQSDTVSILKNNGDGTFSPKFDRYVGDGPYSVLLADIGEDAENDINIITANNNINSISILISNFPPTITILEPDGVDDVVAPEKDTSYTIKWTDDDPDDPALVSLYYLCISSPLKFETEIVANISEDDETDKYVWNISDVPEGDYLIIVVIEDQYSTVTGHSDGLLTITYTNDSNGPGPGNGTNDTGPGNDNGSSDSNDSKQEDGASEILGDYFPLILGIIIIILCLIIVFFFFRGKRPEPEGDKKPSKSGVNKVRYPSKPPHHNKK